LPAPDFELLVSLETDFGADSAGRPAREVGFGMMSEIPHETAASRLFAESLSMGLLTYFASAYHELTSMALAAVDMTGALDGKWLQFAAVACLSRHHFTRAFRWTTGLPPNRYVSGQRLNYAKHILSMSGHAIMDIALEGGLSSQTSFTRAFQRGVGMPLGAYRHLGYCRG
jgi:AraC family transcriptional regulator